MCIRSDDWSHFNLNNTTMNRHFKWMSINRKKAQVRIIKVAKVIALRQQITFCSRERQSRVSFRAVASPILRPLGIHSFQHTSLHPHPHPHPHPPTISLSLHRFLFIFLSLKHKHTRARPPPPPWPHNTYRAVLTFHIAYVHSDVVEYPDSSVRTRNAQILLWISQATTHLHVHYNVIY